MKSIATVLALLPASLLAGPLELTILHTNDLHAHIEPVTIRGKSYGGYARHVTLVKRQMAQDGSTLLLSGGDTFQGTLYFKVYKGLADAVFLNMMGYHAMAVGNHEFDLGPAPLGEFVRHATFPVLSANLDLEREPTLSGVKPHVVITVKGERVGLVGATTPELPDISSPGPNVNLKELNSSLQKEVDSLSAARVDKVILLSHLGYEVEKKVAAQVRGIDLIIGGHSHTLLGEFKDPNLPKPEGPYPTIVKNPGGNHTLLVSSWEWGKVLGRIRVSFNSKGAITRWTGDPIVVDDSIPEDPVAASVVRAMQEPILALKQTVVATLATPIEREGSGRRETPMGNLIADAMLEAGKASGAQIAFMNAGGIRSRWDAGPLTYDKAIEVQPFGNQLVMLELSGSKIKEVLEYAVSGDEPGGGKFLQVSRGFSFAYDPSAPSGGRVSDVRLGGEPLAGDATYKVVTNNFTAGGGDGFHMLKAFTPVDLKIVDLDALLAYLKQAPTPKVEGRITVR